MRLVRRDFLVEQTSENCDIINWTDRLTICTREGANVQISEIQKLCKQSMIKWSTHCLERMQERDISRDDVKHCILKGEIIEDYPEDYLYPSCLIYGYTIRNSVLHVVVGNDGKYIWIITAYYPNTVKFEVDLKTRRRR